MEDIDREAYKILEVLKSAGHIAYFAGGCVRDMLLARPCKDADIATSATTEEIFELFDHCLEVGASFGVVHVVKNKKNYEVATFRSESGYSDGRHPDVIERSDPSQDAKRRDFTINGMFYDPEKDKILDFVGGKEDLKKGVIRAIGDPSERFKEDRLRLLRGVRFSAAFGFEIEPKTYLAMQSEAKHIFPAVSSERICDELTKMGQGPSFGSALQMLFDARLLGEILPGINGDTVRLGKERLQRLNRPLSPVVSLALFCIDIDFEKVRALLERYFVTKADKKRLQVFGQLLEAVEKKKDRQSLAHLFAEDESSEALDALLAEFPKEAKRLIDLKEELAPYSERIKKRSPVVAAKDLMQLGICPGELLGELLHEAERLSIEEGQSDKELLIEKLQGLDIWPCKGE